MTKILLLVLLAAPAPALAQNAQPFTGLHAGIQAGLLSHHFYLERTQGGQVLDGRYFRSYGLGGGAFAGHDWALGSRWRAGVEAGLTFGGTDVVAAVGPGELRQSPRYGYRLTARGGVVAADRLWLYGVGGYGGNRYRITNSANVSDVSEWGSSFIVGAGAEYRVSDRFGVRLDFRHTDNQSNEVLLGIPVRF